MQYKIVRQNNEHLESSGKYYAKIVQNDVIDTKHIPASARVWCIPFS